MDWQGPVARDWMPIVLGHLARFQDFFRARLVCRLWWKASERCSRTWWRFVVLRYGAKHILKSVPLHVSAFRAATMHRERKLAEQFEVSENLRNFYMAAYVRRERMRQARMQKAVRATEEAEEVRQLVASYGRKRKYVYDPPHFL